MYQLSNSTASSAEGRNDNTSKFGSFDYKSGGNNGLLIAAALAAIYFWSK